MSIRNAKESLDSYDETIPVNQALIEPKPVV